MKTPHHQAESFPLGKDHFQFGLWPISAVKGLTVKSTFFTQRKGTQRAFEVSQLTHDVKTTLDGRRNDV